MPIAVVCKCGKAFKVKDDAAGSVVVCQVCGAEIVAQSALQPAPAEGPVMAPASAATPQGSTISCPACAEQIPANSRRCSFCGETLSHVLGKEEQESMIAERIRAIEAHARDFEAQAADAALKGRLISGLSICLAVIFAFCMTPLIAGAMSNSRDAGGLIAVGIIFGLIFGIPLLVSLLNDYKTAHIQDAERPDTAVRRFLIGARTARFKRAYAAVAPSARAPGQVETLKFKNPQIPAHPGPFAITDAVSFKKYWRSVFAGPSMQTRTVQIKRVQTVRATRDLASVEIEIATTNYSSWILFTILISIWICIILILVLQKKEVRKFRKLLIRHDEKWYFAESELEGVLDHAKL